MSWKSDAATMEAIQLWLVNQKGDLDEMLSNLFKHNDGSPFFLFLQIYGKFVFIFDDLSHGHTESDAFDLAVAHILNDPALQQLTAQMVGAKIDKGLNIE